MIKPIQFYIDDFKETKDYLEVHGGMVNEAAIKIEQCEVAIQALEREQKYGWHDLRKNPNDIPKSMGLYIVCTDFKSYKGYNLAEFWNDGSWRLIDEEHFTPEGRKHTKVIAWRNIEPIEGA